jgi:hypothetical protein
MKFPVQSFVLSTQQVESFVAERETEMRRVCLGVNAALTRFADAMKAPTEDGLSGLIQKMSNAREAGNALNEGAIALAEAAAALEKVAYLLSEAKAGPGESTNA